MIEHRPARTEELPTSSVEGFARFIMDEREGTLKPSHLEAVFAMKHIELIDEGLLPRKDHLSPSGLEYYQGKTYQASQTVRNHLRIDDKGDWAVNFSSEEDAIEFIEEQAQFFAEALQRQLKEEI